MSNQISGFIANARAVADEVKETFGGLTAEQLNWKPNAESWSVGQCFDHLITTNDLYMGNIQKVADGDHKNNVFSMIPFLPDFFGGMLKKAVSPEAEKKVRTFPIFEPSASDISENIIDDFVKNQERLISLMEETKNLDCRKIKIVTPVSNALNIRLADAFELLVIHEKRHFKQARRVMETEGFPGA